jgi:hypothetical protein
MSRANARFFRRVYISYAGELGPCFVEVSTSSKSSTRRGIPSFVVENVWINSSCSRSLF